MEHSAWGGPGSIIVLQWRGHLYLLDGAGIGCGGHISQECSDKLYHGAQVRELRIEPNPDKRPCADTPPEEMNKWDTWATLWSHTVLSPP